MKVTIGIDLGGTRTKVGLVKDGSILASSKVQASPEGSLLDHLSSVALVIDEALSENNLGKEDLSGVGLAFPSIVDSDRMKILSKYVKYTDADSVDLKGWAENLWDTPLVLENDARAALIGEWQYGAGQGCNNVVLITLGTGVGTAALIEGKLLKGSNYLAGNLGGHMTINLNGPICNCGNIGCLETEASTWALKEKMESVSGYAQSRLANEKDIDFHAIFDLARQGDSLALEIREHSLKAWSLGIISLIHTYDPERLVLGGGIMKSKEEIIPVIQDMVNKHAWIPEDSLAIVPAAQVEFAGILGLSYLINQR